jgi:hypothetical protein
MSPEFSQSPYYFKIAEEMLIVRQLFVFFNQILNLSISLKDTPVFKISARDGDSGINNQCSYEINYRNLNFFLLPYYFI